ncbi:hypothetical protein D3C84_886720 [compost metagenome]
MAYQIWIFAETYCQIRFGTSLLSTLHPELHSDRRIVALKIRQHLWQPAHGHQMAGLERHALYPLRCKKCGGLALYRANGKLHSRKEVAAFRRQLNSIRQAIEQWTAEAGF